METKNIFNIDGFRFNAMKMGLEKDDILIVCFDDDRKLPTDNDIENLANVISSRKKDIGNKTILIHPVRMYYEKIKPQSGDLIVVCFDNDCFPPAEDDIKRLEDQMENIKKDLPENVSFLVRPSRTSLCNISEEDMNNAGWYRKNEI